MAGELNFGLIDTSTPLKAANAFYDGRQEMQKNALAKLQLEAAQGQNELTKYGLSKARREDESQNALLAKLKGLTNPSDVANVYMQNGQIDKGLQIQKSQGEMQAQKLTQAKTHLELAGKYAKQVMANPSVESALAALTGLQEATGKDQSAEIARVQAMSPQQIQMWAAGHAIEADKLLPKFEKIDIGGTVKMEGRDPFGNIISSTGYDKTVTPDAKLNNARALQIAQMNDARARAGQEAEESRFNRRTVQEKTQIVPTDDGVYIVNKGTGTSTPVNRQDGKPLLPKGSPMYDGENKFNSALRTIEEAKNLLPYATGSMIGRGIDVGASVFGKTTKGAEASDALKVLSGALISGVPRFKGSDSDKDVAIYKQLAGNIGDETIPYERRLSSLKQVETMLRNNAKQKGFVEKSVDGNIHDLADAILNGGR